MKIVVRTQHLEMDEAMYEYIMHRLLFRLGRFLPRILRVTVQFVDVNGPRGGEDTACRIEARLLPAGSVFVEDTDSDPRVAVDRASDRVARSVSRAIERARDLGRNVASPRAPRPGSAPPDAEDGWVATSGSPRTGTEAEPSPPQGACTAT